MVNKGGEHDGQQYTFKENEWNGDYHSIFEERSDKERFPRRLEKI